KNRLSHHLCVQFIKNCYTNPFLFDETITVLNELKNHYKLLLITNGAPSLQYTILQLTPELYRYFQDIVISGSIGDGKHDSIIFDHAIYRESVRNEEV